MTMTCSKCFREVDFDSPRNFCEFHWLEWWHKGTGDTFIDNDERLAKEHVLMRLIKFDNPEDHDLMKTLINQYWKWLEEDDDSANVELSPHIESILRRLEK